MPCPRSPQANRTCPSFALDPALHRFYQRQDNAYGENFPDRLHPPEAQLQQFSQGLYRRVRAK